jgi:hypothetical protein
MSEALFILTTIYVAYVVFVVVDGEKTASRNNPKKEKYVSSEATIIADAPLAPMSSPESVAEQPAPVTAPPVETKAATVNSNSLRNPKTGEISKISSYPFTKRWIKEALVSEGLLEKIYTNAELNDELNVKIRQALETLKEMPDYQQA